MVMVGISLVDSIGDRRMTGRCENRCGPKAGGINLELNCVAMAIAENNCFGRMVENGKLEACKCNDHSCIIGGCLVLGAKK